MRLFFVLGIFGLHFLSVLSADEQSRTGVQELERSAVLSVGVTERRVSVALGQVAASQNVTIELTIRNELGRMVQFDSVSSHCRCIKASIGNDEIESGDSFVVNITLDPEVEARAPHASASIVLVSKYGPTHSISVTLNYELLGMLKFSQKMYVMHIDEKNDSDATAEIRLPFFVTKPIRVSELVPEIYNEIYNEIYKSDYEVKVVPHATEASKAYFVVTVPRESTSGGDASFRAILRDAATGKTAAASVVIVRQRFLRVSPTVTRFHPAKNGKLHASSMIILSVDKESSQDDEHSPRVSVEANGKQLQCKIGKMSDGVYRATLTASEDTLLDLMDSVDGSRVSLKWSVKYGAEFDSQVTFLSPLRREDTATTQRQIEAASLLDAHIANFDSIQSFDLLIESTDFITGLPDRTQEIQAKERWLHSKEQKFDLHVRSAKTLWVDLRKGDRKEPAKAIGYQFQMLKNGRLFSRVMPQRLNSVLIGGTNVRFESESCVPILQFVGLERYPMPGSLPENYRDSMLHKYRTPQRHHSMVESRGGDVTVFVQDDKDSPHPWHYRRRFEVDTRNLVIRSFRMSQRKRGTRSWSPMTVEEISWGKVGDIRVPRKCSGESVENKKDKDGSHRHPH